MKTIFRRIIPVLSVAAAVFFLAGCGRIGGKPECRIAFADGENAGGAKIIYKGREVGAVPRVFNIRAGIHVFKIVKPGFEDKYCNVLLMKGDERRVDVRLTPAKSNVLFTSTPQGAKVFVGNELRGVTPFVLPGVTFGKYDFRVEKSGYTVHSGSFTVDNSRPVSVASELSSLVGRISVNSSPGGAELFINDKLCGKTPFNAELEEGRYMVKLEKPGYSPLSGVVEVKRAEDRRADFRLIPIPGELVVNSNSVPAMVYCGGKAIGQTPFAKPYRLAPGKHRIRLSADGYDDYTGEVEIVGGAKTEFNAVMDKNTGGIDLEVMPAGTKIYLNGRECGVVSSSDGGNLTRTFELRDLKPGKYEVMAFHRRGRPDRVTVTVNVLKGRIVKPEPIVMWVANAEIKNRREGKIEVGVLYQVGRDKIVFGPQPGVKIEYEKSDIEYIKMLDGKN